ncbi:MAG: hypothetical protein R3326_00595 [Gemmatimonadota bacterium]|nr:hypothetical protein [Gemmatimonadota bacterium]
MKKWIVPVVVALVAWPALADAQEKPTAERPEAAAELPRDLAPLADRVESESPASGVRAAWGTWLDENPDLVAAGEAPRYALIVLHQGAEQATAGVREWLAEADRPDACPQAIEADIAAAHEPLHALFHDPNPDLADLDAAEPRLRTLADALEACHEVLEARVNEAARAKAAELRREPTKGEEAEDDVERPRVAEAPEAADEDADEAAEFDAGTLNDRVERAEMIEKTIERLRTLSELAGDLHVETRTAVGAAGDA